MSKAWRGWRNPEFVRNLWLELSPQRVLLMPALIALILFVAVSMVGRASWETMSETIVRLTLLGFAGITIIWGARAASNALLQEFLEGTWDNQRMSGLTPWQMVWGKLLGGAIYPWYGGVLLLAIAAMVEASRGTAWGEILRVGVGFICFALLAQTTNMLRLLSFQHRRNAKRSDYSGVLLFMLLGFLAIQPYQFLSHSNADKLVLWWEIEWRVFDFAIYTLVAITLWALAGLWQAMRRELLLRNRPWCWLAFLLFWLAWGAGFIKGDRQVAWFGFFLLSTLLTWVSMYLQLAVERKDQGMWIYFIAAWKRRDAGLLQHLLPKWVVSALLALVLSVVTLCLAPTSQVRVAATLLSVAAFVLRDTAWILWLNLAPGARHADTATVVSLVAAYGLLPLFNKTLFLPAHPLFQQPFQNVSDGDYIQYLVGLTSALIQAAIATGLLHYRWRKTFG
jgi:hypothetical protein